MPETRMDYTGIIPMTVQNIMLEHMEVHGMPKAKAIKALIGIAQEMRQWDYYATNN